MVCRVSNVEVKVHMKKLRTEETDGDRLGVEVDQ